MSDDACPDPAAAPVDPATRPPVRLSLSGGPNLEGILDLLPDPVFIKDEQHRWVLLNDAFCAFMGHARADLLGKSDLDFFPADEVSVFLANDDHVLRTGIANVSEERFTSADGQTYVIVTKKTRTFDEAGRPYVVGIIRDVTERKRLEVELRKAWRESVQHYQALATVSPVGIFHTDPDGNVRYVNQRWQALTGTSEEAAQANGWLWAVHPDDRETVACSWRDAIREHRPFSAEFRFLTPRGETPWVLGEAIPVRSDEEGPLGYVGTVTDVTELKEVSKVVAMRTAELQQAQELVRLKTEFVNAVSHDLRTPLTSVVGYAEFLEDAIGGELSPAHQTYVHQIQQGARRLVHLVNDLLDFARLESGTFQLRLADADLCEAIRECVEGLLPQITEARLTLSLELPDSPLWARFDAQRIDQVLTNLLHNAIKFTPAGGKIAVRTHAGPEGISCEVQDTGDGIDPADLPKLFQHFSQLEGGSAKGGTGLGLSISRAIVEAHGGAIGVTSMRRAGSTFWFTLPLQPERGAEPPQPHGA